MSKRRRHTARIRRWLLAGLLIGLLLAAGGCSSLPNQVANPGMIETQRLRAVRFDPYPDNKIAPEIVGGRPLDFQVDRAEANRARLVREGFFGFPL